MHDNMHGYCQVWLTLTLHHIVTMWLPQESQANKDYFKGDKDKDQISLGKVKLFTASSPTFCITPKIYFPKELPMLIISIFSTFPLTH